MVSLERRVERLEAIEPACGPCQERGRRIYLAGEPAPDRCEGCGRPIESFVFTLDIDRASGREDDEL